MSFIARNHPNYKTHNPKVDDRATTPEAFKPLNDLYKFTVDVAAAAHNTKCDRYYDIDTDGLAQDWAGERVWCNPPFSNIRPWIEKAATSDAELIVMLLPANRTEQAWWQDLIEPNRDTPGGPKVEFLRGRMRFINAGDDKVKPNARPPFGCCLIIWGDRGLIR